MTSSLETDDTEAPLADPARRLAADLIDSVLLSSTALCIPVGLMFRTPMPALVTSALGASALAALLALNAVWVHRHGQSIGKRALGLRVVGVDGQRLGLGRIVMRRNVLPFLLGAVVLRYPFALVDGLMVFTRTRRTLHDRLAGSIVIAVRRQRSVSVA